LRKSQLAAASIAQVHLARLKDGTKVVVKVQRPGITKMIEEDLQILRQLAGFLEKHIPESRKFNPSGIIKEFGRALELETNFVRRSEQHPSIPPEFRGRSVDQDSDGLPRVYRPACVGDGGARGNPLSQKTGARAGGN